MQTEDGHLVTTVKSTQQKSSVQMELGINAEQNAMGKSVVTVKFELLPRWSNSVTSSYGIFLGKYIRELLEELFSGYSIQLRLRKENKVLAGCMVRHILLQDEFQDLFHMMQNTVRHGSPMHDGKGMGIKA